MIPDSLGLIYESKTILTPDSASIQIGYTELVYRRINKKLNSALSKDEIEKMISTIIAETSEDNFHKIGKNIYITNHERNVRLTINSYTNRIITADEIEKKKGKC